MILHFILLSVLLIHFIPVRNKYDVSYIVVPIDYLRGIHMTIPFQIIQRWIGKYEFYNHCILRLKKTSLGVTSQSTESVGYRILSCLATRSRSVRCKVVQIEQEFFDSILQRKKGSMEFPIKGTEKKSSIEKIQIIQHEWDRVMLGWMEYLKRASCQRDGTLG